ncbi:MAG: hypothetical protein HC848_11015 [Limnobacter sp.]|nr:hypothetical protein [Limnobacter sp.]
MKLEFLATTNNQRRRQVLQPTQQNKGEHLAVVGLATSGLPQRAHQHCGDNNRKQRHKCSPGKRRKFALKSCFENHVLQKAGQGLVMGGE